MHVAIGTYRLHSIDSRRVINRQSAFRDFAVLETCIALLTPVENYFHITHHPTKRNEHQATDYEQDSEAHQRHRDINGCEQTTHQCTRRFRSYL